MTADLSQARVVELGADRVAVQGVTGHARPDELKVNVCYRGGWLAEAEISYAGVQAEARARQAADIVRRRLGAALRLRADLIGVVSVLGDDGGDMLAGLPEGRARDVRLRLAAHAERAQAERLLREVTALTPAARRRRRAHRPAAAPEHDVLHHPARRGARRLALPGGDPAMSADLVSVPCIASAMAVRATRATSRT